MQSLQVELVIPPGPQACLTAPIAERMPGWSERIRTHAFPIEPGLCVSIPEFGNTAGVDRAPCAAIPAWQTEKPDPAPPTVGALGDAPHVSGNIEPIRSYAQNPPVSAETPEWNKTSSSELRVKKSGGPYGSDNALPEMRKANGSGCYHLRPHRLPMHRL